MGGHQIIDLPLEVNQFVVSICESHLLRLILFGRLQDWKGLGQQTFASCEGLFEFAHVLAKLRDLRFGLAQLDLSLDDFLADRCQFIGKFSIVDFVGDLVFSKQFRNELDTNQLPAKRG